MPEVSVIINCYNGEKYLRETIESVYKQTFNDWEIILWDDASTDNTENIAKSFDDKLKYFKGEKGDSLGQVRNWALERASGDYIAILDQDDIWMPEKLELQMPLFYKNPSVGLVFSDAIDFYEEKNYSVRHFAKLKLNPPKGHIFGYLFKIDRYPISMPTAVFRRKALDGLSEWFDSRYKYAEEYDLFLRIAYNWECDYVNKPLAIHRIHESSSTFLFYKKIPMELESIMEKIQKIYPSILYKYKKEIRINKRIIEFQYGKAFLKEGKIKEARRRFIKSLPYHKSFYMFFASFFMNKINRI